ncbi:MAG: threonine--tRNA ligase [bacterium]
MSEVKVTFPDGSVKGYPPGTDGREVARSVSGRLAREAVAVKVAGVVRDLDADIVDDAAVRILTFNDREGKEVFWHSTSHVMAQAVLELFPQARPAIGPSIEEGFYYDFEVPQPFSPDDLERIEKRMGEIIKIDASFSRIERSRREAIDYYRRHDNAYKVELLEEIPDDRVTFYQQSEFEDLCRGPHLPRTGMIKAFKLTSSSGAYWRGDEKRPMLQRIYGISFPKKAMLEEHLRLLEEAKKRDHRVLGKQLELYTISEDVGAGLILWLPKGARVRNEIENFWRSEHLKYGYELVYSPHIAHRELWDRSGHNDFFSENMFGALEVDQRQYQLKPMNCPFHIHMYKSRLWSYRDLPLRWAELGTVYRYERAGVLHGLLRVRGLTQDDAHHFVTQDKMEQELVWLLDFCVHILKSFGFNDYAIFLSTRPEKAIGDDESWERAEAGLKTALEQAGLPYEIDEGEGAFYGPKIDIQIKDALNRSWQCSTIQFDFSLPERFDLHYIDTDGQQKRPFMIHRALLGAIERFFGLLIEHYAGCFPLWLAPVQVKVLPITDSINEYGRQIVDKLKTADIRAVLDDRSEKVGAKIRDAELQKVPYMFVVGAKEAEAQTVSVRKHGRGDLGAMTLDESLTRLNSEIVSRGLNDSKETD